MTVPKTARSVAALRDEVGDSAHVCRSRLTDFHMLSHHMRDRCMYWITFVPLSSQTLDVFAVKGQLVLRSRVEAKTTERNAW